MKCTNLKISSIPLLVVYSIPYNNRYGKNSYVRCVFRDSVFSNLPHPPYM